MIRILALFLFYELLAYELIPLVPSGDVEQPYKGAWLPNATIPSQHTQGWQIDLTNLFDYTNDNNSAIVMRGEGTLTNFTFRIERANADMSVEMVVNVSDHSRRLCMCELQHEIYNLLVVNPAPNPTDIILSVSIDQFVDDCDSADHHWKIIESLIIGMLIILTCCGCTGLICFSGATKYICFCCCGRKSRPISSPPESSGYYSALPSGSDTHYKAHDDHKRYMGNQQYGNSIFQSGSLNADHDQGRNPHIISNSFGNRSISIRDSFDETAH